MKVHGVSVIDGLPVSMVTLKDGTQVSEEKMKITYWKLFELVIIAHDKFNEFAQKIRKGNSFDNCAYHSLENDINSGDQDVKAVVLNAIEFANQHQPGLQDPRKDAKKLPPFITDPQGKLPMVYLKDGNGVTEFNLIKVMKSLREVAAKSNEAVEILFKNLNDPSKITGDPSKLLKQYALISKDGQVLTPDDYIIRNALEMDFEEIRIVDPRKKA